MKKIYSSVLRRAFKEMFPPTGGVGGFALTPVRRQAVQSYLFPSDIVLSRPAVTGDYEHVVVSINPRQESFNADVAWSESGSYPQSLPRPSCRVSPSHEELNLAEAVVSYHDLAYVLFKEKFLDWAVWDCSVSISHPDYLRIFALEDAAPVSLAEAEERVAKALGRFGMDLENKIFKYLELRAAARQRTPRPTIR